MADETPSHHDRSSPSRIDKATAQGAKVLVPKTELPDGDTMAILLDPHGMSFGLVKA